MEFLRPILGRSDVCLILRSGSRGGLLRVLGTLNLDRDLVIYARMADSITPFVAQPVYQQRVSLVGKPSYGKQGASLKQLHGEHAVILPTLESGVRWQFEVKDIGGHAAGRITADAQ